MSEYPTDNWVRPSPCLMPRAPDNVGVGVLEVGKVYPTMNGSLCTITQRVEHEGQQYIVGRVVSPQGFEFDHYFELSGRDWTDNPNNPYAIDWPLVEERSKDAGWGKE